MSSAFEDRVHFEVPWSGEGRGRLLVGDIASSRRKIDAATGKWDAFVMRDKRGEISQLVAMSEWLSNVMSEHDRFENYQDMVDDDLSLIMAMESDFLKNLQQMKVYINTSLDMCENEDVTDALTSGVYGITLVGDDFQIGDSIDDDGNPTMCANDKGVVAGLFSDRARVTLLKNKLTGEVEGITAMRGEDDD